MTISYKRLEGYEDKIKKGTPESVLKVKTFDPRFISSTVKK